MHGWLLLVWVQGLIQAAFLDTGATAGTIDTKRNISAEEGGSVILQCHFSSDTAEVTQVDWEQQDQLLAIYSVDLGWHVSSVFSERVVPGPSLGLTFQSLTMNDTGEYFCTYHTYPGGIYKGRIFLKVQESSVAQFQTASLGGTMAAVLGLICLMVTGVTVLARKSSFYYFEVPVSWLLLGIPFCRSISYFGIRLQRRGTMEKSIRMHSIESGLGRTEAEPQEWSLRSLSSPGGPVQTQTAPAGPCGEQAEDDYADPQDYFNVLSYRSLESFIAVSKTG